MPSAESGLIFIAFAHGTVFQMCLAALHGVLIHGHADDGGIAGHLVHDGQQDAFHHAAQTAGTGLALDGLAGNGVQGFVTPVNAFYIVDSYGALYPEESRRLADLYCSIADKYGKSVGIHAHNNQQLAFANTIEAMTQGVSYLDATVDGMGRGAGNCALELLLGFLKNPKYQVAPILKIIEEYTHKFKAEGVKWGYDIPYLLTGQYNTHPRPAIQFVKEDRQDYYKFSNELYDIINS